MEHAYSDARERRYDIAGSLILLATLLIFIAMSAQVWNFILDDAFITFRYASHLAGGNGLVWNVGERMPNEGATSFLWVVFTSISEFLHTDTVLFSKISGFLFTGLAAALCSIAVWRSGWPPGLRYLRLYASALTVALFLVNSHLPIHAVSGMEVTVAMTLVAGFYLALAEFIKNPNRKLAMAVGLLAFLGGLARPELNLSFGASLLMGLIISSARPTLFVYGIALYGLSGAAYFLWRWQYFGLLLPLPFYVKQAAYTGLPGALPVYEFVVGVLLPLYLFFVPGLIGLIKKNQPWLPAAIGVLTNLAYFVFPSHIMGLQYRFLYPIYPAILIIAGLGIKDLLQLSSRWSVLMSGLVLVVGSAVAGWHLYNFQATKLQAQSYGAGMQAAHIPLGQALARLDSSGTRILGIGDSGAVPYYSGWRTIDTYGLNDRTIALTPRGLYDAGYVLSQSPDILVLISSSAGTFEPFLPHEKLLYERSLALGYRKIGTVRFEEGYYLWLLTRDYQLAATLESALSKDLPSFER